MHLPGARTGRSLKERSRERAEAMDLSAAPNLVPMIAKPEGGPSSDMQRYEG